MADDRIGVARLDVPELLPDVRRLPAAPDLGEITLGS
jgi:hypothetical protein